MVVVVAVVIISVVGLFFVAVNIGYRYGHIPEGYRCG